MILLHRLELQTQAYTRSVIHHFWVFDLNFWERVDAFALNMIKWLMLFCISSPLIWAPSSGAQTGIPASESPWIRHWIYIYICIHMNILYFIRIYQYFSCLHSFHSCSVTHNTYFSLPLPLLSIFSAAALRGEILMSGLENKWKAIDFSPICTTKTNELGLRRGQMRVAEQR